MVGAWYSVIAAVISTFIFSCSYNRCYMSTVSLTEKNVVELLCPNIDCGHKWTYRGKSRFYASCPFCRTNVHVFKNKLRNLCLGNCPKPCPDKNHWDSNFHDSSGGEYT